MATVRVFVFLKSCPVQNIYQWTLSAEIHH